MAFGAGCRRGPAAKRSLPCSLSALCSWYYAKKLWPPAGGIGWISPFKYNTPRFEHVMGSPCENLLVLWAVAILAFTWPIQSSAKEIFTG